MNERDYQFLESTFSFCPKCMRKMEGKIILKDKKIYIKKVCPEHGSQLELLEEDAEYFLKRNEYDKPSTISSSQTKVIKGCPYDCGICEDHEQHTCIGLIEVTKKCNLNCPV